MSVPHLDVSVFRMLVRRGLLPFSSEWQRNQVAEDLRLQIYRSSGFFSSQTQLVSFLLRLEITIKSSNVLIVA